MAATGTALTRAALSTCATPKNQILISYFSDPEWTNYPARLYRIRSP